MAQFPTSVKSFTARSNGQTLDASHVQDLQDEVNAIEDGILNGTARLNSSNSTIVNLSVSGNSTLTGSVTFSSVITATAQPRCSVYSSAAQQFAAGTLTAVTFESEQFDVGGLHSTASNPERLTIPTGSSGLYLVGTLLRFSTGANGDQVFARLLKNSTTEVGAGASAPRASSAGVSLAFSQPVVLDAADYMTVEVLMNTSTGSLTAVNVRRLTSEFWCVKLW